MNDPRPQSGFTLLEALLALVLMGIILGLAYGGLNNAIKTTQRGEDYVQRNQAVRTTHQFLRRQLGRMLPLSYINDGDDVIMFEGDADRVTFVAPMPGYLGFGGSQVQQLELVRGDEGYELLFRHAVLTDYEDGELNEQDPILLLEGIEDGGFEFLPLDDQTGEPGEWTGSWEDQALIPVAVAVNLELDSGLRSRWPDLIAVRKADGRGSVASQGALQQQIQQLINQRRNNRNREDAADSGSN